MIKYKDFYVKKNSENVNFHELSKFGCKFERIKLMIQPVLIVSVVIDRFVRNYYLLDEISGILPILLIAVHPVSAMEILRQMLCFQP